MSPEERVRILLNAPADGWVAFSENESSFITYGATYDEAVKLAEEQGITEPVLVKVPVDWEELVL